MFYPAGIYFCGFRINTCCDKLFRKEAMTFINLFGNLAACIGASSFLLDLAAFSGRLCKVPQNAKKPTGFYTNRLCNSSLYSVLNLCRKQFPYVICIPLIWKQHRHNPKSIIESCDICVGGIFTIFFVPALQ